MSNETQWYEASTGGNQGLVVEERTGRNVAVSYDKKDARLIAAAPDMFAALQQVKAKVLTQHNFLSTATDQERRDALEHLIDWWNGDVVPLLAKIKG